MFFGKSKKWNTLVQRLQSHEITAQEFVDANEKKTLFYSTPFFENESGQHPNVLQAKASDITYFPVFTSMSDLKAHMAAIGCARYMIIKGDLKGVLDSLDSHPLIQTWGVVIDPQSPSPIDLSPGIRVQPKCLR